MRSNIIHLIITAYSLRVCENEIKNISLCHFFLTIMPPERVVRHSCFFVILPVFLCRKRISL